MAKIVPATIIESRNTTTMSNEASERSNNPITVVNNALLTCSAGVDHALTSCFRVLGRNIYKRQWAFIFGPVFIVGLCAIGFANISVESDPDSLYTPQSSEAFGIRDYFNEKYSDARSANIYVIGKKNGDNIATKEALLQLMDMYTIAEKAEGSYEGVPYNLLDVCIKARGTCVVQSVLVLWNMNRTKLEEDPEPFVTMATKQAVDAQGRELSIKSIAGNDVVVDNGRVTTIHAYKMTFDLQEDLVEINGEKEDPETTQYELAMQDDVRDGSYSVITPYVETGAFRGLEEGDAITADLTLIFMGTTFLVIYGVVVMTRRNLIHSHGSLAIASCLAVGLSIGGAFGFTAGIGVKFSLVINAVIFLLFGLGIDDTFVLVSAFMDPEVRGLDTDKRIEEAMARAGASITITSITDIIAFLAGSNSEIPAIQDFCYYAAVGVTFDFFLQITFFVSIMLMSAKREEKGKYDFLCCVKASPENLNTKSCSDKAFDPDSKGPMRSFLGGSFADFLLKPTTKVAVLVVTAALLGYSGWAYSELQVDFDPEDFVPRTSYLQDVYDVRDQYFERTAMPVAFLSKEGSYETASTQQQMAEVSSSLQNSRDIVPGSCVNWWNAYYEYMNSTRPSDMVDTAERGILNRVIKPQVFYSGLVEFLNTTTGEPYTEYFSERPTNTSISDSRIDCLEKGGSEFSIQDNIDSMERFREIAGEASNVDMVAHAGPFLFFDGLKIVEEQILINILYATIGVFCVCVVLLGGLYPALLVLTMIICIDLEVFGSFYYWDVSINYVSAINLVVAVGLSVDACAHIAHSFLTAKGTRNERAKQALDEIGPAVTNGLISTLLVLVPLSFAQSYIFQIFLRCFFNIIVHSLFHGVVVFPVVLSLIGPESYDEKRKKLKGLSATEPDGLESSQTKQPDPNTNHLFQL
eukprot:m.331449 g.331449  ORF g.331449 m.331449 type:complete len:920 (+) comp16731_c0_seq1:118-2877(+)